MAEPQTPRRPHGSVDAIVSELNSRYGLHLPIREEAWSPSTSRGLHSEEDKIVDSIRILYFQDNELLQKTLDEFDIKADEIHSEWRFKPRAGADVLPHERRRKSAPRPFWMSTTSLPDSDVIDALIPALANILAKPRQEIKSRLSAKRQNHGATGPDIPLPSHKAVDNYPNHALGLPSTATRTRRRLFVRGKSSTEPAMNTSSDDYPCDFDEFLRQAPSQSFTYGVSTSPKPSGPQAHHAADHSSSTAEYVTPPLSPSARRLSDETLLNQQLQGDLHSSIMGRSVRKRSFSGAGEGPRKLSGNGVIRHASVAEISTAPYTIKTPSLYPLFDEPRAPANNSRILLKRHISSEIPYGNPKPQIPSCTTLTSKEASSRGNSLNTSFTTDFGSSTNQTEITVPDLELVDFRDSQEVSDPSPRPSPTILEVPFRGRVEVVPSSLGSRLLHDSPFSAFDYTDQLPRLPFRYTYEFLRVAGLSGVSLQHLYQIPDILEDDYNKFWGKLANIVRSHNKVMPERSQDAAWRKAGVGFSEVALSGKITFTGLEQGPLLQFRMNPLRTERSYRLARKYGSDRFLVVSFPMISQEKLPKALQGDFLEARKEILQWLVERPHNILGRRWRAFFPKAEQTKKERLFGSALPREASFRVYMFAESGIGFRPNIYAGELDTRLNEHKEVSVADMIRWFMPLDKNRDQSALKLFSRLKLAVSSTHATIAFDPSSVIYTKDAYAHAPHRRMLDKDRIGPLDCENQGLGAIMSDGCARISKAAARKIADACGLDHPPSAFQARFAGAKGLWPCDTSGETIPGTQRDIWIEITSSQVKFESHDSDKYYPDKARVTFEVNDYSKRLTPAALNFQLLPILLHQGVEYDVFRRLLQEDLTRKIDDLEQAMKHPVTLRKWVQDTNSTTNERIGFQGINMRGGLPSTLSEVVNFFIEQGFMPQECSFLRDRLYKLLEVYCRRLESRMNIGVGRSTYALMVPDPLAILNEGEVHFGFSKMFHDPISEWRNMMLHDVDVLVSRSPAVLPSDIQKVRARFLPELLEYRDVIVFSVKGACSLAEKLSGGDFDGDRAWVCWDPSIVQPFHNYVNPADPRNLPSMPDDRELGIEKDVRNVSSLVAEPNDLSAFLHHAFDFTFQENMLGRCTAYHEALCYHGRAIDDPAAMKIASLAGRLVDGAKGGLQFSPANWRNLLDTLGVPRALTRPAYKNRKRAKPTNHALDRLVFEVAKDVREATLARFCRTFGDAGSWDPDLVRLWKFELEEAARDPCYKMILDSLVDEFRELSDQWSLVVGSFGDDEDDEFWNMKPKRGIYSSFSHCIETIRLGFSSIQPTQQVHCARVDGWMRERDAHADVGCNRWELIKASGLFYNFHKRSFVWHVAGSELGILKANARGPGSNRPVIREIHEAMKIDQTMAKNAVTSNDGDNGSLGTDDTAFEEDDIDWDEVQGFCD